MHMPTAKPACRDIRTPGREDSFGLSTGHAGGAIFVERKKGVQRPFSLEKTRFFFFFSSSKIVGARLAFESI